MQVEESHGTVEIAGLVREEVAGKVSGKRLGALESWSKVVGWEKFSLVHACQPMESGRDRYSKWRRRETPHAARVNIHRLPPTCLVHPEALSWEV